MLIIEHYFHSQLIAGLLQVPLEWRHLLGPEFELRVGNTLSVLPRHFGHTIKNPSRRAIAVVRGVASEIQPPSGSTQVSQDRADCEGEHEETDRCRPLRPAGRYDKGEDWRNGHSNGRNCPSPKLRRVG